MKNRTKRMIILDRFISAYLWVFLFAAPLIFNLKLYDFSNLPKIVWIQTGSALLLFLWLLRMLLSGERKIILHWALIPVATLIAWSFFSMLWAQSAYEAFLKAFHLFMCGIVLFVLLQLIRGEEDIYRLLFALFCSGFVVAVLGYAQHLASISALPQFRPLTSTFGNKNMAVHYIVMTFPLGIALLKQERRNMIMGTLLKIFCVGAQVVMLAYLFHTSTRAGWLAVAVEILFIGLYFLINAIRSRHAAKKEKGLVSSKNLILYGAGFLVLAALINLTSEGFRWTLPNAFERVAETIEQAKEIGNQLESAGNLKAGNPRIPIYANSLEMGKDHFFLGVGIGNFYLKYPEYVNTRAFSPAFSLNVKQHDVHNDYIQFFVELGIAGLLLFLSLFAVVFVLAWPFLWSETGPNRLVTLSIVVSAAGIMVDAFFSFPFQRAIPPLFLFILIGILIKMRPGYPTTADKHSRTKNSALQPRIKILSNLPLPVGIVASFAALVLIGTLGYLQIRADYHFRIMYAAEKQKEPQTVLEAGFHVLKSNPFRTIVYSSTGRAKLALGYPEDAVDDIQHYLAFAPYDINALYNLGLAYYQLRLFPEAIESLAKVHQIKPDIVWAHYLTGRAWLKLKEFEEAYDELALAVEMNPRRDDFWYNLGLSALYLHRFEEAQNAFSKAVGLDPDKALNHFMLGNVMFRYLGNKELGAEYLQKSLELNPKHPFAQTANNLLKE